VPWGCSGDAADAANAANAAKRPMQQMLENHFVLARTIGAGWG